jgi:molybdopterin synthase catalytic subunit
LSAVTSGRVLRAEVSGATLDVEAHRSEVELAAAGAVVTFSGAVRNHDAGRKVTALEYVGHPTADEVIGAVAARIAELPGVLGVSVSHRVGSLEVGDVALAAAVSCAHRREAFAACAQLVDDVKHALPVWKRQVFADGSDEWVNCP